MVHSGVMAQIRVFVLDDHEVVRQGLLRLNEADPDMTVVGEAATAAEAIVRVPRADADVALLDVRLPDGSGIEVCRELATLAPGVRCLMLTSYEDDEALLASITAGAAGYVLKEIRGPQLLDSIRLVASGRSLLDPTTTGRVLERLREARHPDSRLDLLTAQESAVLDLIGEGLTNREIADRMFLAEKTVKNYISSLLAKIEVRGRTQAALFIAEQHRLHPDSTGVTAPEPRAGRGRSDAGPPAGP
jgi:DNA-binding NarL/FixJ family response regulator